MSCVDWHGDKQSEDALQTHISETCAQTSVKTPLRKAEKRTCYFLQPSISPFSSSLPRPSITPHVWGMLSWKRLSAPRVYKRRRGFAQSRSFAFLLLKLNKASWREKKWICVREKWKLIIFLHVLPFISLHTYLSVLISFLSQVMTRFTLIMSSRMKVKVSYAQRHKREPWYTRIHTPTCYTRLNRSSNEWIWTA